MRLDWQSAEVADAHVEENRDKGDVGNEGDEEHEFGVGELVHEGSFLKIIKGSVSSPYVCYWHR